MRLDHLLSKEHTPSVGVCLAAFWWCSLVESIDFPTPVELRGAGSPFGGLVLVWWGWGHTVGVLRHQVSVPPGPRPCCLAVVRLCVEWVVVGGGVRPLGMRERVVPGQLACAPVGVWGGGVGLLFEIWIVDASIFVVCCSLMPHGGCPGWAGAAC